VTSTVAVDSPCPAELSSITRTRQSSWASNLIEPGRVTFFREPAAYRLHAYLDLQILRHGAAGRRVHHDPKRSDADIWMGPERYDARTHAPVHDDRKGRSVVRGGRKGHCQEQPESGGAIGLRVRQSSYPMNVARISMG